MAKLQLEVITAEKVLFSEEVDMLIAPGSLGELGILPNHAPILSTLDPGRMIVRRPGDDIELAVTGGFLELSRNHLIVLADAAERSEEIDLARAEAARDRAEDRLRTRPNDVDLARAQAALQRALVRIRVGQRRRRGGQAILT